MPFTHSKSAAARHRSGTSKSRAGGSRRSSANGKVRSREPDDRITPSTGNVFEDVGFPPHEARRLLLRSHLVLAIGELVKRRKLTQAQAARLFGVTQPRINDLLRGKIDRFSIDSLIAMLGRAGVEVTIQIKPAA